MNKELPENSELSHYRIVSKIGAGGMGEVYRAHDSRLGREVAIKVLPDELSNDEDRLRRFAQEAKATSALNHPNILTVYDIGEHEGSPFIVSELLEGEELRARLDDGPIPIRKVVDYAQQIVSGLSAAHERGITHRDLKPENLFITSDERVKILDFGLAKLSESETNPSGSEDATRRAMTNPGVIMGTAGYMSPEQVRGTSVDHRSDIFSFGVILYEMLSGRRAFHGDSIIELMNAIIKEDVPDLDDENRRVPPSLDKLMRRCLEKKAEHRFYSAHDLGFALDALSAPTSSSGTVMATTGEQPDDLPGTRRLLSGWLPWAAAALFLLSTLLLAGLYFRPIPTQRQRALRFTIDTPEKTVLTEASAISPDGQQVAFVVIGASGVTSLWLRHLSSVEPQQLAGTEGAQFPFWSPDSRFLGFFSGGKLRKVEAAGGPVQTLAEASTDPRGGAWAPDGTIIFSPDTLSPLMRVSGSGGATTALTVLDNSKGQISHRWPSMMPDGRHFIFFGRGIQLDVQGLYIASVDSPDPVFIVSTSATGSYAEVGGKGYLLFVRDSTLVAQPFDAGKRQLSGEAGPLVEGILSFPTEIGPTGYTAFSAAAGTLVYRTGDQQSTRLTWYDRTGKSLGTITEPGGYHEPSLSSDGKKVLVGRSDGATQDIYLLDVTRGNATRLTFDPGNEGTACLSPDGSQVFFYSNKSGQSSIYRKASSGAGSDELLYKGEVSSPFPGNIAQDGKYLVFEMDGGPRTKIDLWVMPLAGDGAPFPYLQTAFVEAHPQFSPDGRWIAYTSDESGRAEVYVQSFPISGGKWQISTAGGDQAQWRADGKELFYMAADRNLMTVAIGGGSALDIGRPLALFQTSVPLTGITDDKNNYVPTQDGDRFLVNELADAGTTHSLFLILNWASGLKQ